MTADVAIGWVHPGQVHAAFLDSLLKTLDRDRSRQSRIAGYCGVHSSANVSSGRNRLVAWFLDQTPCDWLLMVDTDMVWEADALARLLAYADPRSAPVVGGLCFAREADTGAVWPTLFHLEPVDDANSLFIRHDTWPANELFQVGGTGAAFLLTHRSVLEAVRDNGFSKAYPWFQETENRFGRVSEDLTFCQRLHALNIPVHVHTGVEVGHIKPHIVMTADYLRQHEQRGGEAT